ncbi:MAG: neutral/alkaline non-lysosomal ceramidase N-terminal domain-containing protein [Planctomycetota bacterium]|nr:neutral/alkaline non-lysosomal ceramidase N-terminal domain-containing protein [Planctomycetota bacterium]
MNAGAAEVDITPDFEVELSGFALRTQPATGVLDPVFVRCIYLDDGSGGRLLWMVADVLALEPALVASFRAWAGRELALQPEQVMLAATHTHNAPGVIALTAAGRRSERYVQLLRERMERAASDAVAAVRPCEVVAASGTLDLGIDRRDQPTKHVDPTVWSLGFREPGGGPFIAAILNYAMHPVSLGPTERRISPDWCGGASASLAHAVATQDGSKPIAIVTNGACGNVNPPFHGASREQVFAWGKSVADAVAESLASATPLAEPELIVRSISIPMPLDRLDAATIDAQADRMVNEVAPKTVWPEPFIRAVNNWHETLKSLVARGGGGFHDIELQAVRIAGVTILAANGEIFSRFTDDLRRATGEANLFVVGYANNAFGYIPTREAYAEGGYEVDTAHFFYNSFRPAPGSLEMLCDNAARLVRSMR